jgi:hypothetical protein
MRVRPIQLIVIVGLLAGLTSCREVDLRQAIEIADVATGYYEDGKRAHGYDWHFVPSITFRVKNAGTEPVANVQFMVSFWKDGEDGEFDSVANLRAIGDTALAPNATSEPITARATVGYNLEGPRAELFDRSPYKDTTIKLFAKRGGRFVPKGEYKVERRIIMPASPPPGRP